MLVLFALVVPVVLAVVGLLFTVGVVFAQRQALQGATDAASLRGTWQLLAALQADARNEGDASDAPNPRIANLAGCSTLPADTPMSAGAMDAEVWAAVLDYAGRNGVAAPDVSAEYLDAAQSSLGSVGAADLPRRAVGVRVTTQAGVGTVLPGFVGLDALRVVGSGGSALVLVGGALPVEMRQTAIPLALNVDDYVQAVASAGGNPPDRQRLNLLKVVAGLDGPPLLDLRSVGALDYRSLPADMRAWSAGNDTGAEPEVGDTIDLSPAATDPDLNAQVDGLVQGLCENIGAQSSSRGASKGQFALVTVPLWDTLVGSPPRSVRVAGFGLVQVRPGGIAGQAIRATVVPYAPAAWGVDRPAGPDLGARTVRLVQ